MALQDFKITYRDWSTQTVKAERHVAEGSWVVFYDSAGQVHRVPAGDVQSVSRGDVGERVSAEPGFA